MNSYAKKTIHARGHTLGFVLCAAVFLTFGACREPIFYIIQQEVKLKEPVIPGGPGAILKFENALYVASGKIYTYSEDTGRRWKVASNPPAGKTLALAATNGSLYALTGNGESLSSSRLYQMGTDKTWRAVENSGFRQLQSVFGAGDKVFVGAYNTSQNSDGKNVMSYGVMTVDDGAANPPVFKSIALDKRLTGACKGADGAYYLATGSGLYVWDGGDTPPSPMEESGNFISLFGWEDFEHPGAGNTYLLGILRDGSDGDKLWYGAFTSNGFTCTTTSPSSTAFFTGAAGVWSNSIAYSPKFLLLGRGRKPDTTVTYTYGYYEVKLESNGSLTGFTLRDPGNEELVTTGIKKDQVTTVAKNEAYA
ncbi:MAG: hypothetical protein LBG76_01825, partial [Treponema sp.]|nr:hypothetical protein [Treponema sp.]